jgi:tRNA 2-thiouridine synthesizing protein A
MSKTVLNVTGLSCPLPVLHTQKVMKGLSAGALVEIRATDPAVVRDIDAYCRSSGSDLISQREEDGLFTIEIRKGG